MFCMLVLETNPGTGHKKPGKHDACREKGICEDHKLQGKMTGFSPPRPMLYILSV